MDSAVLADHRVKLKLREKKDCQWIEETVEYERDVYINCNWGSWYSHQRIDPRLGGLGNNGMGWDCPNYSIIEISQNTEKSPGDLRRLAVTQIPVKDHQLMLMWKTIIIIMMTIIILEVLRNTSNTYHIYQTPPLGQDMTQGQFLSEV